METTPLVEALKYGALGLGFVVLCLTALLLSQELKRDAVRQQARNLIVVFMIFSLIPFAAAGFLELEKQKGDQGRDETMVQILSHAARIDENLGAKYDIFVKNLPGELGTNLRDIERKMCAQTKSIVVLIRGESAKVNCERAE